MGNEPGKQNNQNTSISPMLAVRNGTEAIEYYKNAFGAIELWRIESNGSVVAGLVIDGANFFLAEESPSNGTSGPDSIGTTTVRIELFVEDPADMQAKAVVAGGTELEPVKEHQHETTGIRPINRMLQGAIRDPYGHMWLIGRILE
jgi:PhnB protein